MADNLIKLNEEICEVSKKISKPKRIRKSYNKHQKATLENIYSATPFLKPEARQNLSQELGVSETRLKIWFRNRRMLDKKNQEFRKLLSEKSKRSDKNKPTHISENSSLEVENLRAKGKSTNPCQTDNHHSKRFPFGLHPECETSSKKTNQDEKFIISQTICSRPQTAPPSLIQTRPGTITQLTLSEPESATQQTTFRPQITPKQGFTQTALPSLIQMMTEKDFWHPLTMTQQSPETMTQRSFVMQKTCSRPQMLREQMSSRSQTMTEQKVLQETYLAVPSRHCNMKISFNRRKSF